MPPFGLKSDDSSRRYSYGNKEGTMSVVEANVQPLVLGDGALPSVAGGELVPVPRAQTALVTSPALVSYARRCRPVVVTRTDMGSKIKDAHIAPRAIHRSEDPEAVDITLALRDQPLDQLPWPIIHEETGKVIDGQMVLEAIADRFDEFEVLMFSGTSLEAAELAMALDAQAGRRRTNADRRAAAKRMIELDPSVSDNWIAQTYRLGTRTVAEIRARIAAELGAATGGRMGKDGITRVPPHVSVQRAVEHFKENPEDSRSETKIAKELGVARSSVHLAKEQMREEAAFPVVIDEPDAEPDADEPAAAPTEDADRVTGESESIQDLFEEAAGALAAFVRAYDALPLDEQSRWFAPLPMAKFDAAADDSRAFNRIVRQVKNRQPHGTL